jgi:hypothetical protein
MRGLWDHEQPLSPSLLRSAMALVGGFLALTAALILAVAVGNVLAGNYVAAALQVAAGIALPFAIWLSLKMLADMLTVLNRSHDRLEGIEERLGEGATVSAPRATVQPNGPAAVRASDDGPAYPVED